MDAGLEFEEWLCHTLPWQLNVSSSKEVAIKTKFGPFADYVRPIVRKAPKEFEVFFLELKKRIKEVSDWKAPRGYIVIPEIYKGEFEKFPNGRLRHRLSKKI
ncbi:MAG: hypothetical protein Q8P25_05000 [Candidatus Curtissbacteria bacterium]|nr:hypothetical protein [Candidatus Curtissbacteria bacterium]